MGSKLLAAAGAALSCTIALQGEAQDDWPQFLGRLRSNAAPGAVLSPTPRLEEAWRKPLPAGTASVIVSGGRAFTLGSDGDTDILFALDAATGAEAWRVALGPSHADAANGPGAAPAAIGDVVVALGTNCVLRAVRAADGAAVWDVNLAARYSSRFAARGGCRTSPLIVGDLIVLPTGATEADRLVGLDARTGEQRWSAPGVERSLNTSPGARASGAGDEVLYHFATAQGISGIAGVRPADGRTAWTAAVERGISDQTPLALPGTRLLLQTWAGSTVLDASAAAVSRVWANDELTAGNAPAVYHDGHLYGFGGNSGEFFKCVDASTGRVRWTTRPYRGTVALVGGAIAMVGETSGLLRLVAADPAAYREIARLDVFAPGRTSYTSPAFAQGRLFVRNLEEIVAVALR
jgi:outer membrane protein assembly factor BamB